MHQIRLVIACTDNRWDQTAICEEIEKRFDVKTFFDTHIKSQRTRDVRKTKPAIVTQWFEPNSDLWDAIATFQENTEYARVLIEMKDYFDKTDALDVPDLHC